MRKISFSLILIVLLSFLFRFIWLDKIPVGLSNDELDYVLDAKALFLTGSDISGTWNPLSLTAPTSSFPKAEISPLITFSFIGPLPLSLILSKLIYVLFSTGTVVLIYLITKKLIGVKEAIAAGFIASINPWLIFLGRTAYDSPLAVFFFLFAFYLLLITKGWKILWSFPLLFIAFFSYLGTKLIFIPFSFIAIFFTWFYLNKKKYKTNYLIVTVLCLALFTFGIFSLKNQTRTSEILTPRTNLITQLTNDEKRTSVKTPLTVLSNRYLIFTKYTFEKYMKVFSPEFLFLYGDPKGQFSLWEHGSFYYIDALFLVVGICSLFQKNKKILALLSAIALISPIPGALSTVGTSFAIRSLLLCPILIIFIGTGVSFLVNLKNNKITALLLVIYFLLILNFINIYFFRNPIYNSESFSLSGRVLAKYLSLQKEPVYVINGDPKTPLKQYLFYTNSYNNENAKDIAKDFQTKNYLYKNLNFITCKDADKIKGENIVIYDDSKCMNFAKSSDRLTIAQLGDAGSIYTIQNDKTCNQFRLNRYPYGITFSDFSIESLSSQRFCEKFITKY